MSQPSIDGRTFAGIDLPTLPERGPIELRAARAWVWQDGSTDRMYLDRDVEIKLGPYQFSAPRAVVWLEPVTINGEDADHYGDNPGYTDDGCRG